MDVPFCSVQFFTIAGIRNLLENTFKYRNSPYLHEVNSVYLGDPFRKNDLMVKDKKVCKSVWRKSISNYDPSLVVNHFKKKLDIEGDKYKITLRMLYLF